MNNAEYDKAMDMVRNRIIADFYDIPICNVKKLMPTFFNKEKYVLRFEKLQLYLRLGLKLKKHIEY